MVRTGKVNQLKEKKKLHLFTKQLFLKGQIVKSVLFNYRSEMSLTLGYLSYSSFYPIFSCVSSSLHTSVLLVCIFSDALAFDPCLQFQRVPLHWQLTT